MCMCMNVVAALEVATTYIEAIFLEHSDALLKRQPQGFGEEFERLEWVLVIDDAQLPGCTPHK